MHQVLCVVFVALLVTFVSCELPSYIGRCKADDPEINKCIINTVNNLRPKLATGIPELDVPPIEPMILDEIALRDGLKVDMKNLIVHGGSMFEILDLNVDIPNNTYKFKVKMPFLKFRGDYDINMKVLQFSLKGKGPIYGNLTDYTASAVLKADKIQQNGGEYLKFEKVKLKICDGDADIKLDNLFNGNKALEGAVNDVVNENREALVRRIRPAVENSLAKKFTDIANKITLKFTVDELFL